MNAAPLTDRPIAAADIYPAGTVANLIGTGVMTPATTRALQARLEPTPAHAAVLDASQMGVLAAVSERLVPQPERTEPVDLPRLFHHRLATGNGDGWRWAEMPSDLEACRRGLDALDAAALATHGITFPKLLPEHRDDLLREAQFGRIAGDFGGISPARWFTEVLALLVDVYYAHPTAQAEIGYTGMADARGWPDVGIGARASHEPEPV